MSMVVAVFSFLLSRFHPRHRLLPPAIMFITGWRWCRQRRQPLISSAMVYELCNVTFYQSAATAQLLDSLIQSFGSVDLMHVHIQEAGGEVCSGCGVSLRLTACSGSNLVAGEVSLWRQSWNW